MDAIRHKSTCGRKRFYYRVAAFSNSCIGAGIKGWANPVVFASNLGEGLPVIKLGKEGSHEKDPWSGIRDKATQLVKKPIFQLIS